MRAIRVIRFDSRRCGDLPAESPRFSGSDLLNPSHLPDTTIALTPGPGAPSSPSPPPLAFPRPPQSPLLPPSAPPGSSHTQNMSWSLTVATPFHPLALLAGANPRRGPIGRLADCHGSPGATDSRQGRGWAAAASAPGQRRQVPGRTLDADRECHCDSDVAQRVQRCTLDVAKAAAAGSLDVRVAMLHGHACMPVHEASDQTLTLHPLRERTLVRVAVL
jgi:hypothetical protein